jgi:Xaa-Pro aminopeptidase
MIAKRKEYLRTLLKERKLDVIIVYSSCNEGEFGLAMSNSLPAMFDYYFITPTEEGYLGIDYLVKERKLNFSGKLIGLRENFVSEDIENFLKDYNKIGVIGNSPFWQLSKIHAQLIDLKKDADKLFTIKSKEEIEKIKISAKIVSDALNKLKKDIKPGKSQEEIEDKLREFLLKKADSLSFGTSVVSGDDLKKGTFRTPGKTKISEKDAIVIDAGVSKDGFISDCTRMYFINTPEIEKNYLKLIKAHNDVIKQIKPGMYFRQLVDLYKQELKKQGLPEETLFVKDLGHSIGFKLHENPIFYEDFQKDIKLEENMIITLEPDIVVDGYYLRVEDMILIKKKSEILTK